MVISLCKWFCLGVFFIFQGEGPLSSATKSKHPFYVSVVEINHNARDKTLEISCKIFTNDFERALEKFSHSKIDLSAPADKASLDQSISAYITKHLQLQVDGHPVVLQYVGSEKESDATWCYFQVTQIPSLKKLDILNSLLYESFESEINIMHVTVNGSRKSTKLNNPDTRAAFEF